MVKFRWLNDDAPFSLPSTVRTMQNLSTDRSVLHLRRRSPPVTGAERRALVFTSPVEICEPSVDSAAILKGERVVTIAHNGFVYRLQATRANKLILTK